MTKHGGSIKFILSPVDFILFSISTNLDLIITMAESGIEENAAERKFGPQFDDIHM